VQALHIQALHISARRGWRWFVVECVRDPVRDAWHGPTVSRHSSHRCRRHFGASRGDISLIFSINIPAGLPAGRQSAVRLADRFGGRRGDPVFFGCRRLVRAALRASFLRLGPPALWQVYLGFWLVSWGSESASHSCLLSGAVQKMVRDASRSRLRASPCPALGFGTLLPAGSRRHLSLRGSTGAVPGSSSHC